MLRPLVLGLLLLQSPTLLAQDNSNPKSPSKDRVAKLLARIEQLENRVQELERRATSPPAASPVPQYQPYAPPPNQQPHVPKIAPAPKNQFPTPMPYMPYFAPQIPYSPPSSQNKAVPDTWKPFNFNGQQYYIIPLTEAEELSPLP